MTAKALPIFPRGDFWEGVWGTATLGGIGFSAYAALVFLGQKWDEMR